jgi:hypothetical protein
LQTCNTSWKLDGCSRVTGLKISPLNIEYKIFGLSEEPCQELTFTLKRRSGVDFSVWLTYKRVVVTSIMRFIKEWRCCSKI